MKKTLQASMTAVLLSTVAIVPAVTISVIATADAAYAKSDKGGGNDKGNSGGNGSDKGNKGGKSAESKSKSKSGSKSSSNGRSSNKGGIGGFFSKLTGQDKKAARATAAPKTAKVSKKLDPMHPSNLGNMNGAMNANINAVLAHIKNGNTNGPVGMLAGLAVANVNAEGAQDVLDLNTLFDDLAAALGDGGTVDGYYQSLDAAYEGARNEGVEAALLTLESDPENLEAQAVLAEAGFADAGEYQQSLSDAREAARDSEIEDAITALGGDPVAETDITETPPSDEAVAEAEANLQAQSDAELAILDSWNKNPDATDEITAEEQALLDKLNERLVAEDAAIRGAIGTDEDVAGTCEVEEGCEITEEEIAVVTE